MKKKVLNKHKRNLKYQKKSILISKNKYLNIKKEVFEYQKRNI